MKEAEYFQQARDDADYRRAKIVELREQRKTIGWVLLVGAGLEVVCSVYLVIAERHWLDSVGSMLGSVTLLAWVYTNIGTRLAALEAMEGKTIARATTELERPAV